MFSSTYGISSFVTLYLEVFLLRVTFKHGRHDVVAGGSRRVVSLMVSSVVRLFCPQIPPEEWRCQEEKHR